jgi:hypothetical protein
MIGIHPLRFPCNSHKSILTRLPSQEQPLNDRQTGGFDAGKALPMPWLDVVIASARLATIERRERIMADVKILATGLGFPEGPVVCADGSVVLTEIRNQRCSRVTPDGKVSVFSNCGGGPNGLAIGPDGYFYLCNNGGSRYVEGHSMGLGQIGRASCRERVLRNV